MARILFVVNDANFFVSHRLAIGIGAVAAGHEVHVATPEGPQSERLRQLGFLFHPLQVTRSGLNPFAECITVWRLCRLFRRVRPAVVHLVTIKPVLYGGIAVRIVAVPAVVAAISGLGTVFSARGLGAGTMRWMVGLLYRFALGHRNLRVIVQNPSDRETLQRVTRLDDAVFMELPGSGTDLERFRSSPEPPGPPRVVMVARMLFDKGVGVFVDAARRLREAGSDARFVLVGGLDPDNPSAVNEHQLRAWVNEGVVEWWGHREDIERVLAEAALVVHPSHYGEGMPKVLLDAAAAGRAVITTDWPGCRDAIEVGVTGLLVPPRDDMALATAIRDLLEDPERRQAMGAAARRRAERLFSVEHIVEAHLAIYRELLA